MAEGQGLLAAGLAEVQALNRAGRWQEALAAAANLYARNRTDPKCCLVLADTLGAIGRIAEATAVLQDARRRMPGQPSFSIHLAELAARASDWPAAVLHWRAAGLPRSGTPAGLRLYALALAGTGEADAAQAVVASPDDGTTPPRELLLAQAELHLRAGRTAEADALWHDLSDVFSLAHAGFARLTAELALQPDDASAAPMIDALLAEADPGSQDWVPAIAAALAALDPQDRRHARVRTALRATPMPGMAGAVAEALCGDERDPDRLATRMARAVSDGRSGLLPLLLETSGPKARLGPLRVALRLYVNRVLPNAAGLEPLGASGLCALLRVAHVLDPDVFDYIAGLLRARLDPPVPRRNLSLPHPEDVLAQVSHAQARPAHMGTRQQGQHQGRLRVAVCLSGRLSNVQISPGILRALRLQGHDAVLFAHVWRNVAQARPDTGRAPGLAAFLGRLPHNLGTAFATAAEQEGLDTLRPLYPLLLLGQPVPASTTIDTIDPVQVAVLLHTDHVVVEDDGGRDLAGRSALWKARHAARAAHRMAADTGTVFDLVIHVTAGSGVVAEDGIDWGAVAAAAHQRRVMFADVAMQFDRARGLSMGDGFGIGAPAVMDLAADSVELGDLVATGRSRIHGFPAAGALEHSLAMQMHLHAVSVEALDAVQLGQPAGLDPVAPAAALALLWQDIRARRPAASDSALVRAAMADVTGGIGV